MPYRQNYPASVNEVLDDSIKFNAEALRAVREFASARPWCGPLEQRQIRFARLCNQLSVAYRIVPPQLVFQPTWSCSAYYVPGLHRIVMAGKLSVVTFLHEFAHARGFDERQACRWSINLFRRCFPRSYGRCRHVGHMLIAH